MMVLPATFERLSDVDLWRATGAVGVYVLWAPRAKQRPTYIGEGNLLSRIGAAVKEHGDRLDGTVAIIGYEGVASAKFEAEVLEAALLEVAEEVDRSPVVNGNRGKWSRIDRTMRLRRSLRIRISGMDPLLDPRRPPMAATKLIQYRDLNEDEYDLDHDWRTRKLATR